MKYCSHCGAEVKDEAVVCVHCGCSLETEKEESSVFAILAIVFGALGGWLGLVFGVIGLATYKNPSNKTKCKIGIALWAVWLVILVILWFSTLMMV